LKGNVDGAGTAALFSGPVGITQISDGTFYVADATNHTIRKITSGGTVTTFAGRAGISGASDGTGIAARFNNPTGIAADASGNIYVADTTNNLIRKISPSGVVTTLAGLAAVAGSQDGTGSGALFNQPSGLAVENRPGEFITPFLYVADTGNSAIRKITPNGVVTTIAGLPTIGGLQDGIGTNTWFNQPKALVVSSSGDVFVADTGNAAIRKIAGARFASAVVTTVNLTGSAPTITTQPAALNVTSGSIASFSVVAAGISPLTYQWRKDGADIAGATASSYSISSTSSTSAGNYTVVVSNLAGSVTSGTATLTVNTPVTPAPAQSPAPSGGGGGGGAPSLWFVAIVTSMLGFRGIRQMLRRSRMEP